MQLVQQLKEAGQDNEFYPTDSKSIQKIVTAIRNVKSSNYARYTSFLDIGAGSGKVLSQVRDAQLGFSEFYAIEKSQIHLANLDKHFLILGADFHKTTLIEKEVDVAFSNPPYSEYEIWAEKIIKEIPNKALLFLLIPSRWKNSQKIQDALKDRNCEFEVIHSFDFAESEDRVARAKADLIQIQFPWQSNDSFDRFFNEMFTYPEPEEKIKFEEKIEEKKLVNRLNLVEALCELYEDRMQQLYKSFQAVCDLDYGLLQEFEITKEGLIGSLKLKLANAKKEYWQRLFDSLDKIHERLTKSSREKIVNKMNSQTGIEFNRENVYAILGYVLRYFNDFVDDQFIETYEKMVDYANVENYKSNHRVFKQDQFRYYNRYDNPDAVSHYKLKTGNRIVLEHCGGLSNSSWSYDKGLEERAADFIGDLMTIANNLGFKPTTPRPKRGEWDDSGKKEFYCKYKGEERLLFTVRAYKNGNLHCTFDNDFVHSMNIKFGQLKKWVCSSDEAAEEMGVENHEAEEYFNINFRIGREQLLLT